MKEEEPELKFPIIREPLPPPPIFSMDQYVEFVQFFVHHLMNHDAYEEDRRLSMVNVAFRLK